ncbi:MAG: DUF4783 domain-containing protein [Tangfeifania sp.]
MPSIKKLTFMVFLLAAIISDYAAQAQIPNEIISGLKTGNAKVLSEYFNRNIELVVLENDNVYSKAQAKQIVSNFFRKYSPESFTVIHQGGKDVAKSVIGNLVTSNGNFRVYFLLKKNEEKDYIHQLRIEKQE